MAQMTIFWLVLLIISIAIEVITLGLTSIWFAGGALIAVFTSLIHFPIWMQVAVFFLISILLLVFTRPVAVKYFNKNRIKTNVEGMIGRQAIVTSEIDNLQGTGQVTVAGQEWSARGLEETLRIPVGCVVTVEAVSGVKLLVKPDAQMEKVFPEALKNQIPTPMSVTQMEELEDRESMKK